MRSTFSRTASVARSTAPPPITPCRDEKAPNPNPPAAVSPRRTSTSS